MTQEPHRRGVMYNIMHATISKHRHIQAWITLGFISLILVLNVLKSSELTWRLIDNPEIRSAGAVQLHLVETTLDSATSNHHRDQTFHRCAINLYGLPRSFKDHVLPSLIQNVIQVNQHYHCDYFVHFYNKTMEEKGRSGVGGHIDPMDVFLLNEAVQSVHQNILQNYSQRNKASGITMPTVHFAWDTDEDFWKVRNDTIIEIETYPQRHSKKGNRNHNPYFSTHISFTKETTWNILRMWHSQTQVFELMQNHAAQQSLKTSGISPSPQYYSRVAMLRLDVIYMTPIDIYRVPNQPASTPYPVVEKHENTRHIEMNTTPRPDFYFYDTRNEYAVVPGFSLFPVNDRLIYGPYEAVRIWATERWQFHYDYIQMITTQPSYYALRQFGLHDERMLGYFMFPRIEETTTIMIDDYLYFLRVRADGSIWIYDNIVIDPLKNIPPQLQALLRRKCTTTKANDTKVSPWQAHCPVTTNFVQSQK